MTVFRFNWPSSSVLSVSSVVSSFQKARNCSTWNAREDMGGSNGFFENRVEKQGSKMALNGFLFEKRVAIAESMVAQQEGCF